MKAITGDVRFRLVERESDVYEVEATATFASEERDGQLTEVSAIADNVELALHRLRHQVYVANGILED